LYLLISYLIGSIPFGFIIYYLTEKKDIRDEGSGNIGATNILRTKGKTAGLMTLVLDILKGALPILYGLSAFDTPIIIIWGGFAVIVGHIFPVFLKFRGGKGVATFAGVFLIFTPWAVLVFVCVFLSTVFLTRFVSAGSILGVISVFFFILFTQIVEVAMIVFLVVILIIIKHRSNLKRIFNNTENKLSFKKNG
jgi:glycerol-3-phosphate acyltransferase PlsY